MIYTARVVNRDDRPERMVPIPKEMDKMGLEWERFSAIDNPVLPGSNEGSSYTHVEVLRGVEGPLFTFEDDVCFLIQARDLFDKAFAELPEDWDMLYLGGNPKEMQTRYSEHLFKSNGGIHCNHAILYSEKARDYILSHYDASVPGTPWYDHWLFVEGQKVMNCFIMSPMIAWQRPGYSDCRKDYMDYYIEMRSHEIHYMI